LSTVINVDAFAAGDHVRIGDDSLTLYREA